MTTAPSGTNQTALTADQILQFAMYQVAEEAAEAALTAAYPFLADPGVKQLFDLIMDEITKVLYQKLAMFVTFQIISAQVSSEDNAYSKAEAALRTAMLAGDQNAIQSASTNFNSTLAKLINFDGYADPGS
jgi:hypothetical protein